MKEWRLLFQRQISPEGVPGRAVGDKDAVIEAQGGFAAGELGEVDVEGSPGPLRAGRTDDVYSKGSRMNFAGPSS